MKNRKRVKDRILGIIIIFRYRDVNKEDLEGRVRGERGI